MSRDILEAMTALAREKGISPEKLMAALEDALLSAYKKLPGAARYARVEVDPETGDFVVIRYRIPKDLEAELIGETIAEESYIDPETGDRVEPQDPEIDPAKFEQYRDRIEEIDDTPEDFGRIAAQTAKQVILQRIREAERDMMFEEFRDRVGELITGIVQQSDSRYTLVQLRDRVEALLPKGEQVDGERYDHGQRVKAVIKEVSPSTKGPSIIVSPPRRRADQEALRARGPGDRRRPGGDRQRRPRARLPLQDRGRLARRRRRPGRRLRRPARLARAHGRLRAARREDRHHPLQRRARPVRRQGAVARPRPRGARRRRVQAGDGHRPRRPALAGHRARGPERAPGRPPDRLAHRHQVRDRLRRDRDGVRGVRGREEVGGRCQAISVRGRRCPNEALPGSPFCGLPKHQALSRFTTARSRSSSRSATRRSPTCRIRTRPGTTSSTSSPGPRSSTATRRRWWSTRAPSPRRASSTRWRRRRRRLTRRAR